jgi:hypothetical protein
MVEQWSGISRMSSFGKEKIKINLIYDANEAKRSAARFGFANL